MWDFEAGAGEFKFIFVIVLLYGVGKTVNRISYFEIH